MSLNDSYSLTPPPVLRVNSKRSQKVGIWGEVWRWGVGVGEVGCGSREGWVTALPGPGGVYRVLMTNP